MSVALVVFSEDKVTYGPLPKIENAQKQEVSQSKWQASTYSSSFWTTAILSSFFLPRFLFEYIPLTFARNFLFILLFSWQNNELKSSFIIFWKSKKQEIFSLFLNWKLTFLLVFFLFFLVHTNLSFWKSFCCEPSIPK